MSILLKLKSLLLVIAHPDDESLFFAPLLLAFPQKIHILCLSTGIINLLPLNTFSFCLTCECTVHIFSHVGNFYGLGSLRRKELLSAAASFGVSREKILIIEHPNLQDNLTLAWPVNIVRNMIMDTIYSLQPDAVFFFFFPYFLFTWSTFFFQRSLPSMPMEYHSIPITSQSSEARSKPSSSASLPPVMDTAPTFCSSS